MQSLSGDGLPKLKNKIKSEVSIILARAVYILKEGGFVIKVWIVFKKIRNENSMLNIADIDEEKVLGIIRNFEFDRFIFKIK